MSSIKRKKKTMLRRRSAVSNGLFELKIIELSFAFKRKAVKRKKK